MRLLQFDPGEGAAPPAPPEVAGVRVRVRAALGSTPTPTPAHELALVAGGLGGPGGQGGPGGLLLAPSPGPPGGRLARPRWPRTHPTIPSNYWTGDIAQVGRGISRKPRRI